MITQQEQVIEYFEHLANKKLEGAQFDWRSKEQAFYVADAFIETGKIDDDPIIHAMDNGVTLKSVASPSDRPTKTIIAQPTPILSAEPETVAIEPVNKDVSIKPKEPRKKNKVFEEYMSINPATIQRKRQVPGDNYFIVIERGVFRNPHYRKLFTQKGVAMVYNFLWTNLVRHTTPSDIYKIVDNYHKKGMLAYSTSYRHIAKECFIGKNHVINIINLFEHLGIIKVFKAPTCVKSKEPQNIYVLGEHKMVKDFIGKEKDEETFFINKVFLSDK